VKTINKNRAEKPLKGRVTERSDAAIKREPGTQKITDSQGEVKVNSGSSSENRKLQAIEPGKKGGFNLATDSEPEKEEKLFTTIYDGWSL